MDSSDYAYIGDLGGLSGLGSYSSSVNSSSRESSAGVPASAEGSGEARGTIV